MGSLALIGLSVGVAIGFMTIVWIVSLILRNASIVDIFWGLGFITLASVVFAMANSSGFRPLLLLGLVVVWGVRLATYVAVRNAGHGEDRRYRKWRDDAGGAFWWRSYFRVFLLQGTIMAIVALPLTLGIPDALTARISRLEIAGLCVWPLGFAFETIGDAQLRRFKRDLANAGKVMDRGL